jgi:SAM-dependent methyltransferase
VSESFSADWLSLREPYDTRACDRELLERLGAWARDRAGLRVVDLGSGTGANLRRTAPLLGARQSWALIEWDPALIAAGQRQLAATRTPWRYRRLDLARDLERIADEPCDLITTSALLDLASAPWLERLAAATLRTGAALYVTLSYVGRVRWSPADPFDATAITLVDQHQCTDKGFGPALGPQAGPALHAALAPSGRAWARASPWKLNPVDREIQAMLLDGYVAAAIDLAPERAGELRLWTQRRRGLLEQGYSRLEVGHQDLLLLPD